MIADYLKYDETSPTGLRWIKDSGSNKVKGLPAGSLTSKGYYHLKLKGKRYLCHRIVALLSGLMCERQFKCPSIQIDHINRTKTDNRKVNLRVTNNRGNQSNLPKHESTLLGAQYHKQSGKWQSQIQVNGRYKYLGLFLSEEEAHSVYIKAREELNE